MPDFSKLAQRMLLMGRGHGVRMGPMEQKFAANVEQWPPYRAPSNPSPGFDPYLEQFRQNMMRDIPAGPERSRAELDFQNWVAGMPPRTSAARTTPFSAAEVEAMLNARTATQPQPLRRDAPANMNIPGY
jgi:hypothetical protein